MYQFDGYPEHVIPVLQNLRELIMEAASELDSRHPVQETLKWNEPAFLMKGGSTIRMGWKEGNPDFVALYFSCNTKLVETFRQVFGDHLNYEGKRALLFNIRETLPEDIIKLCASTAFTYHSRKNLSFLGL